LALADSAQLFASAGIESESARPESYWRHMLQSTDRFAVNIAGKDIATMGVSDPHEGFTCDKWLIGFWISPEYRGRGVFKQMISFLDQWSLQNNYVRHGLGAWSDNEKAIKAYASVGFVADGEPRPSTSVAGKFYLPMYKQLTISQ
jgi:RimJ/RimL family protein N-acetyltransferase